MPPDQPLDTSPDARIRAVIELLQPALTVQSTGRADSVWITRGIGPWIQLSAANGHYAVMRQEERMPEPVAGLADPRAAADRIARMLPQLGVETT